MNFNPSKPQTAPEPRPKKNRTNEIILALVIAGIAITVTIFAIKDSNELYQQFTQPTKEDIMLHKCNNLQRYYGEVGLDVNIKCDRLVDALVN